MAAKRLSLAFTADQVVQEDIVQAPHGLVLSELSDWLADLEGIILNGSMRLDLAYLQGFDGKEGRIHPGQVTILQDVLRRAGFDLTIEYKNPFQQELYLRQADRYSPGDYYWISNAHLVVVRLR